MKKALTPKKFTPADKHQFQQLLDLADFPISIGGYSYFNQAYHDRNDFLIANATKMYAYHNDKPRSGTGSTIRKATLQGTEVINLYL